MIDTNAGIDWIIAMLRNDQSPDGSWDYPFDTGISTDAYMIILLRTLELNDEELIQGLVKRILSRQEKNGAWKLFYDEGYGNLTATVEAYYALLYSGYLQKEDKRLRTAKKFILYGVRLDTSGSLRDISVQPMGDPTLDLGVNPRLVFNVRQALDNVWKTWNIDPNMKQQAKEYCENVKIVVSGGFNPEKISRFEKLLVPVDIYAVGSYLFDNHGPTVTDYTADVVRVKIKDEWVDMAKVGRKHLDNPDLERVW